MRLVFAGTPHAAVPALTALLDAPGHEVVAVITRPDAPAGRGRRATRSPIGRLADDAGIAVLTPTRPAQPEFLAELAALEPDCCPVVAYGALVPPAALAVPRHGWVNLHFSLLPAWRGAAPVQAALRHGDPVTGASTFLLEAGLDTGPVYGVVTEDVRADDTSGTLLDRLAQSGARLLVATMDGIADGSLRARPQPVDGVSHAPKVRPADVRIDWTAPAMGVDRLVRSATPDPGAWTEFRGDRLGIGPLARPDQAAPGDAPDLAPGELCVQKRRVMIGTGDAPVVLGAVHPTGKKEMAASDWARGVRIESGERLG